MEMLCILENGISDAEGGDDTTRLCDVANAVMVRVTLPSGVHHAIALLLDVSPTHRCKPSVKKRCAFACSDSNNI